MGRAARTRRRRVNLKPAKAIGVTIPPSLAAGGSGDRVTANHWRVMCSCGWERECSSEWAARSVAKLHPQRAPMDVAHVTRVERPDTGAGERQLALT
jgi:hypothetical protein